MTVRDALSDDKDDVVRVLSDAFSRDPVFNYLSPRAAFRRAYFEVVFAHMFGPLGLSHLALDDGPTGCAIWAGPGQKSPALGSARLALATLTSAGLSGLNHLQALARVALPKQPKFPHYYLHAIGVLDSARGRGHGSALLRHTLARADVEGLPAYLENSREENLSFYRRHGFEVLEQISVRRGPTLWLMQRAPCATP